MNIRLLHLANLHFVPTLSSVGSVLQRVRRKRREREREKIEILKHDERLNGRQGKAWQKASSERERCMTAQRLKGKDVYVMLLHGHFSSPSVFPFCFFFFFLCSDALFLLPRSLVFLVHVTLHKTMSAKNVRNYAILSVLLSPSLFVSSSIIRLFSSSRPLVPSFLLPAFFFASFVSHRISGRQGGKRKSCLAKERQPERKTGTLPAFVLLHWQSHVNEDDKCAHCLMSTSFFPRVFFRNPGPTCIAAAKQRN